jgi:hypothetical protein
LVLCSSFGQWILLGAGAVVRLMDSISVKPKRVSPYVALHYRDYRLFWFGQLVSNAGTQMQMVTINWHIYILTGSALALGLTGLMRVVPIFANEIFKVGPEGMGLLYAAQPVGALIAGTTISFIGNIKRHGLVFLATLAIYGLATALYGGSKWFAVSLVFLALIGAADATSAIVRNTVRQLATPDGLRGRVQSLNMMFALGGPQLGNLEAGIVAALWGAPFSVISGGVATVFTVALVFWLAPQVRDYRT